ncbi:PDGLE domain-containing protein [Paenibacillus sp.]|uniref:PDGLE domain-containing protein n=1 Tax=Paenibacillus sp. TaxID=58172 RepID=UPI002D6514B4|nr:PDGLE domain-containing protein [Paenibacillus sp.]HZG88396.1 PDGLE domain-containing protein [Paenibacillus sp.]
MKKRVLAWLAVSFVLAGVVSLFASSHPDGFEKAGEETGYIEGATSVLASPLPDYTVPGIDSWLSASLAGVVGVALTFAAFWGLGRVLARRSSQ